MTVPGNIDALLLGGQRGYQIERSLRFNSADSAYLNRTPASAGNRKTWTWSGWAKICKDSTSDRYIFAGNSATTDTGFFGFGFTTASTTLFISGWATNWRITTQVFRDFSAWYHIVVALDTTQATANDRVKVYVNGVQVTAFSTTNNPTQNADLGVNTAAVHYLSSYNASAAMFDGYLTEIHFIDGQALTPSSFGETDTITGVWKPKRYAGTYGTNGFYLKFADNSGTTSTTLGKDSSGNGNNWTPNNFSVTAGAGNDSLIDTPTPYADGGNGRGNYCTLNPITSNATGYLISPINGNLDAYLAAGSNAFFGVAGTQAITSGKFYWEVTPTTIDTGAGTWMEVGIVQSKLIYPAATSIGANNGGFAYTNDAYKGRTGSYSAYGATWTTNDVIGVALDADNGSITFYKNGVSQGAAYTDLASYNLPAGYYPAIAIYRSTGTSQYAVFNFGQRAFAYTPPSGFLALNTQNLPEPSIKKPSSYMDTLLYTGNGSARSITGLGFSPDFVWTKVRSSANDHKLYDAVRGATKVLESSNTGAEGTDAQGLTAFNSDGFSLGTAASSNGNGSTYVAWCWDESATPGFDIVTYTGTGSNTDINHSLGVTPSFAIIKQRNTAQSWWVWHTALGNNVNANNTMLELNGTAGTYAADDVFRGFTSSVFKVGTDSGSNTNGGTYVAYLWSEVAGFSKFGSYTGNGSTDGPFVFCNFRPRWVLIKSSSVSGESWILEDSARDTYNPAAKWLYPNYSDAESNGLTIDFLSNGFKPRISGTSVNTSSATYIFAAFAESPFKYSLAR